MIYYRFIPISKAACAKPGATPEQRAADNRYTGAHHKQRRRSDPLVQETVEEKADHQSQTVLHGVVDGLADVLACFGAKRSMQSMLAM